MKSTDDDRETETNSETAAPTDAETTTSPVFDAVPASGTILSAITVIALFVPIRRGIDDLSLFVAGGFALLALFAILARRYGFVSRKRTGPIAAAASFVVVIATLIALNRGIYGSTEVPLIVPSVSLVTVGFLTAALGIGVAIADTVGLSGAELKRRVVTATGFSLLAIIGLYMPEFATLLLAVPVMAMISELSAVQATVLRQVGKVIGISIVVAGFLSFRQIDWSFIDLRTPTQRDVLWMLGGIALFVVVALALDVLTSAGGIESADHASVARAQETPDVMLVLIPAAIFVIGPFEELLFRNVIQKSLYDRFSRYGAVVIASAIFAGVHFFVYATAGTGAIIAGLGTVFCFSLILGFIYERTENLFVPAIVHGLNNAFIFAMLYFTYA